VFTHALGDGAELGLLEPWHAEQFLAAIERHREYLAAEIPVAHLVFSVEDSRQTLQRWADAHAADTRHLFGVWLGGELVGCVQLFNFDATMRTCEMGVWFVPEAQGRGLATRACRYVMDWAIRVRGIQRVQWASNPTNAPSIAVAQRLGLTKEGLLRSAWEVGGVRKDSEIWSILADEWRVD